MSIFSKLAPIVGSFFGPVGTAVGAAVGGIAAGSAAKADRNSQKKALELAQRQREQSLKFIQDQMAQSRSDLFSLFPQAQQSRNAGMLAGLNLYGQAFPEQVNTFQTGNYMGQQALLAGLPQMNNAILGNRMDLSGLQAQRVPVNQQALAGLYNPQPLNLPTMVQ